MSTTIEEMKALINKIKRNLKHFGPGIITGAADDDPSGIATYSQAGAQFGYSLLWTSLFFLPLQTAVQEACARIGAVTGQGIAAVIKNHYHKSLLSLVVILLLIANTINIGADIGAMAEAARLIIPLPFGILLLFFTASILILEIFTSYNVYSRILKWFALTLLSYPITVFLINHPWETVLQATMIPHIEFSFPFLMILTGLLGTTISPYMFFWQASEEVEEEREAHLVRKNEYPHITPAFIRTMRIDTWVGMIASGIGAWAIILVASTVLHTHGITDIRTAADAAKALEPLVTTFPNAGYLAKCIFALGIIGLGLLSVPVLAGSTAYAFTEAFNMHEGLNLKLKKAHGFYGVITISTLVGLGINFLGIDPMKALVYTAVLNGVIAVPLIFIILRIAQDKTIMGAYTSGPLSRIVLWITFLTMAGSAVAMFFIR